MSFFKQLGKFADKAMDDSEKARREISLRLFRSVIYDTPVAEGTLRANWQPTVGKKANSVVSGGGRNAGAAVMRGVKDLLEASKFGDTVFLTNNLPYAYRIEYEGWSSVKAPQGMVRKNVSRLSKISQSVARGIRNGNI